MKQWREVGMAIVLLHSIVTRPRLTMIQPWPLS